MKNATFRKIALISGFVLILAYQNCGKPGDLHYDGSLNLSSQAAIQDASLKILRNSCYNCHNSSNASGNVSDITDVEYLIYSRLIIPGEPEISPLIQQVAQGLMPIGRPALSGSEIDVLKSWITGLDPDSQGGGGGTPTPGTIEPKYSALAAQIFNPRCVSCHSTRNYKINSYAELMRLVRPGDAMSSLLYISVTTGATGGKMPQGGSLSSTDIKAIQDWINSGAPNN